MELMHLCCQLQVKQDCAELTMAAGEQKARYSELVFALNTKDELLCDSNDLITHYIL